MKTTIAMTLACAASTLAFGPAAAGQVRGAPFDGTWNVRLVTEQGSCDASYDATIAIRDGQVIPISAGNDTPTSVSGGVERDGSVALDIRRSIAKADASGRLKAGSGAGVWRLSMLGCTGKWTARKQTAEARAD
ncbi:hypothetical protein [Prosthecomicrobium sp. N25]|uniref:hypothetical protein n=1 Tax=Prosthecomicrobium sp. N25 TaxID=3129254 RepID=UPI003076C7DC